MKIRAIKDTVLCIDGEFDDHVTESGLIIKNNIGQSDGIVPRWFRIFESFFHTKSSNTPSYQQTTT